MMSPSPTSLSTYGGSSDCWAGRCKRIGGMRTYLGGSIWHCGKLKFHVLVHLRDRGWGHRLPACRQVHRVWLSPMWRWTVWTLVWLLAAKNRAVYVFWTGPVNHVWFPPALEKYRGPILSYPRRKSKPWKDKKSFPLLHPKLSSLFMFCP